MSGTDLPDRAGPTVLISSAGRRVELLRSFRHALGHFGGGRVLATDCSWYAGAFHDADEGYLVPRCSDDSFVPRMLELCEQQQVDLLVPTIDPELPLYARARDEFRRVGTTVAVSDPAVVQIAADKQATHDWLVGNGLPTVEQAEPGEVLAEPCAWGFPLMVKPRFGSASVGVMTVASPDELHRLVAASDRELLVQSLATGQEHTVDVLVLGGQVVTTVPRRRIEVRSGEVAKAVTTRSPELMELAEKLASALPGAYGPLNVQIFADPARPGRLAVIEINARFGGGFPLSWTAGADMPLALLQAATGRPVTAPLTDWRSDLVMLRYDAAVYVDGSSTEPPRQDNERPL
jgi:carbamoyl-phosphate synthase large subunit